MQQFKDIIKALNVRDENSSLGEQQLAWPQNVLAGFDKGSQVILFAHRPLLELRAHPADGVVSVESIRMGGTQEGGNRTLSCSEAVSDDEEYDLYTDTLVSLQPCPANRRLTPAVESSHAPIDPWCHRPCHCTLHRCVFICARRRAPAGAPAGNLLP